MNTDSKPLVCLFSDPNFFAINVFKNLISSSCIVNIITDNKKIWLQKIGNDLNKSNIFVTATQDYKRITNFSHAIFCGGFLDKKKALADFKLFISNKNFGSAKTLAVFPFEILTLKSIPRISIRKNSGVVYLGDLLGEGIDLNSNLLVPTLIKEMIEKRTLTLGVGELFFPISVQDAAHVITKWLLSEGTYGKSTLLLGPDTTSTNFWKQNIKAFPGLQVSYDTDIITRVIPKGYERKRINSNSNNLFKETYNWIIHNNTKPIQSKVNRQTIHKKKKVVNLHLRYLRPIISFLLLIFIFPLATLVIATGFLFISYKDFLGDRITNFQDNTLLAKTIFVIGKNESNALASLPILNLAYRETSYISYLGEDISDVALNIAPSVQASKAILSGVLGGGIYNVVTPSAQIKSSLDYLYQEISLVQVMTQENAKENVLSAKQVLNLIDFDKFKNLAQQGSILASDLPDILGSTSNKNYLILFENNMELRPTGGFIGSYGIASFGGGKLNGLTVNDIYSADGQLKGHIEPPAPIKNYLGEANWWFRDSNWDPDFPTSAQRAEWFLDKEMGQEVDGVVSVDLTPIKNILTFTGPIFLPDFDLTVDSNNLYEKTQEETQANFFPGSRQKASFLTGLSQVLLGEITKMGSAQRIGIMRAIYDGLEGRSIQIYFHNSDVEEAVDKLNWDGSIPDYSCGIGCYSDFFGDVEANVGVNKANYFISRSIDFKADVTSTKITRDLSINLKNSANPSLGPSGQYKTYLRIMIPPDSQLSQTQVVEGQTELIMSPDMTDENGRKEVGIYVEVNPGETKKINFVWTSAIDPKSQINSYGLYVRKQSGTENDPISIQLGVPSSLLTSQPNFSLTGNGTYTYNTALGQDLFARLSWKN